MDFSSEQAADGEVTALQEREAEGGRGSPAVCRVHGQPIPEHGAAPRTGEPVSRLQTHTVSQWHLAAV